MPPRRPVLSFIRLITLATAAACLACADRVHHAGDGDVELQARSRDTISALSRAPADTVDSLVAARRATVMDRTPIGRRPAPRQASDSVALRDSAAPQATLITRSETVFQDPRGAIFEFQLDGQGKVTGATLVQGQQRMALLRQ